MPSGDASCRGGVDENSLGPLVVTAVLAEVTAAGQRLFTRPLRGKIREDLGDSKRLVSHSGVTRGEAWARVLTGDAWATPEALFEHLSRESRSSLRKDRPRHVAGPGEVNVVEDADASDPLVMLASLVGKHVRELLMARTSRFHGAAERRISGCFARARETA